MKMADPDDMSRGQEEEENPAFIDHIRLRALEILGGAKVVQCISQTDNTWKGFNDNNGNFQLMNTCLDFTNRSSWVKALKEGGSLFNFLGMLAQLIFDWRHFPPVSFLFNNELHNNN
jgi:hypothetical protein